MTPLANKYSLCGGVLLGCVRDGRVNGADPDVDFYVRAEDEEIFLSCLPALERVGFRRGTRWVNNAGQVTEWSFWFGTVKFEFFLLFPEAERRRYFCYGEGLQTVFELPEFELGPLDWLGRTWLAPADPDAYLSAEYGDWRVPNPSHHYIDDSRALISACAWTGTSVWS